MSDLVKRLRKMSDRASRHDYSIGDYWNAVDVAADEIERLLEELAIWKSVFPDVAPESVQPDRATLLKEIERLREERDAFKRDAERDAERYRWLRDVDADSCNLRAMWTTGDGTGAVIDAAIDSEMRVNSDE